MDEETIPIQALCRGCLEKTTKQYPLTGNVVNLEIDIASMLEFCTAKKLNPSEDLPQCICISCLKTIRIAYRYLKRFEEVQEQLNTYINNMEENVVETLLFEVEPSVEENILIVHNDDEHILNENQSGEESSDSGTQVKIEETLSVFKEKNIDTELKQEYDEKSNWKDIFNLHDASAADLKIELIVQNGQTDDSNERLYRYICPICGKKFFRAEPFNDHVLGYELSKITCPRCPTKPIYAINEYFKHYREVHRYHCDICNKKLVSSYGYHYHMKQHNDIKRYKCLFGGCEKAFFMRHLLIKHVKTHDVPAAYVCELCATTFNTNDALRYHLKIHDNKKDHLCTVCGQTFFQAVHLRDHMYRHSGYKKFVCEVCGKSFVTNSSLKKHIAYCTRKHNNGPSIQIVNAT